MRASGAVAVEGCAAVRILGDDLRAQGEQSQREDRAHESHQDDVLDENHTRCILRETACSTAFRRRLR